MNREILSRIEKLEARFALDERAAGQARQRELRKLSERELLELMEQEGERVDWCCEGEEGCECRRKAWLLLGDEASPLDVSGAAHKLHRGEEPNPACLHFEDGCSCRDLAAALGDAPAWKLRSDAEALHRARWPEGAHERASLDRDEGDPAPEATPLAEVQEEAPVASEKAPPRVIRSCDLPDAKPRIPLDEGVEFREAPTTPVQWFSLW